jgi:two-component system sensor histidine kinase KdpD
VDARRPDPEELLARVRREEARRLRGKLTIFLGASPGVGKTFAMLEAARRAREEGHDVVVGIAETHGRYDTGALLLGMEILPRRKVDHKGISLSELDIDAAIARRPGLLLVDELAHTNAPGSRHPKRWQDVEELLAEGISVHTTLNVQHVESLVDVVAQITHVVVRETVPDAVIEGADDVRLIDLPVESLLERLRDGKVYATSQAELASRGFFQEGNLIALREIALRLAARRVEAQMRRYREEQGIQSTWAATERLLVCVSASPASEALLRAAKRVAVELHAGWTAAYVETAAALQLSSSDRERLAMHLRLAQALGAETVTLAGENGPDEIVAFARARNVTRILVGKPTHPSWRDRLRGPFLERLIRASGDIDVQVLSGEGVVTRPKAAVGVMGGPTARSPRLLPAVGMAAGVCAVGVATALAHLVFGSEQLPDVVMLYLLVIVLVSLRWGLGPSLLASLCSVAAFDFFFIPPYHTFAVADVRHTVTFAVMFFVGVIISGLTKRVRDQATAAHDRELRTAALYSLSRSLGAARTTRDVLSIGTKHVHDVFQVRATALLEGADGKLGPAAEGSWTFGVDDKSIGVAEWTLRNGKAAGLGTDTLPSAPVTCLPLTVAGRTAGVIALRAEEAPLATESQQHLAAFIAQIAGALERVMVAAEAQDAKMRVEREVLKNTLLSSVSHDLRTPLAVITGAASTMLGSKIDERTRVELTETVLSESERLNLLVRNLLDMTRLEAGAIVLAKEWQPLEEVLGGALERTSTQLGDRPVQVDVAAELLAPLDPVLLQQLLVNLLENAAKYTPELSAITLSARKVPSGEAVEIVVADSGPGLPAGDEGRIFDKFYRAEKGRGGGVGLGLTICRGIATAHGGKIWAENRPGGGAAFHVTLPLVGAPPPLDVPPESSMRAVPQEGAPT